MANETNIFSFGDNAADPMEKARAALRAVRQYEQDWQAHGVNRVHQHYDDVEGDWLENFGKTPLAASQSQIANVSLSDIVAQLRALGLSKSFIEHAAFPAWWRSELEDDTEEKFKLLHSLTKRLRLEIDLPQGSSELALSFVSIPSKKFKLQKKQENPELFSHLAASISNIILGAIDLSHNPVSTDPLYIRELILQKNSCVSLSSLLNFCWDCGVPVAHFSLSGLFGKSGNGLSKSDGLVVMTNGRPVIVIGSSRKHSAWLLFILAHELGHIACGHLQEGILSDGSLKDDVDDEEEKEANQFAVQLLFGNFSPSWTRNLNQNTLLGKVQRLGIEQNLDPGALVLNYGWQTGNWGCAVAALKRLDPNVNAPARINAYYKNRSINFDFDKDSQEYLEQVNVLTT